MAKYVYPAVFAPYEDGGYFIRFPDIENCFTDGASLEEGMYMANDALCLMLYNMEECGEEIPPASKIGDIKTDEGEFATLIACDTLEYRKYFNNRAVKKTLSIPTWLNTLAEREDINFSAVLQKALKAELHI